MDGITLIAQERKRQIEVERFDSVHDDHQVNDQLAIAGAVYAIPAHKRTFPHDGTAVPYDWPWPKSWWKPTPSNRIKELTKAGALIAAEIDRLLRKESNG